MIFVGNELFLVCLRLICVCVYVCVCACFCVCVYVAYAYAYVYMYVYVYVYVFICLIGNVPHDWLFPRCSCAIIHGGAGTFHTAMRFGTPVIIMPFGGDQPFWGGNR